MAEGPGVQSMGYILGKAEGQGPLWHGHVTAVTVAPDFRRQKLANTLMFLLEEITEKASGRAAYTHYMAFMTCMLPRLFISA